MNNLATHQPAVSASLNIFNAIAILFSSSGFAGPLLKFLRIIQLVSSFRLININFGPYLESFLSIVGSIFPLGNDKIENWERQAAPDTRGKLNKYKVSIMVNNVLSYGITAFFCHLFARFYNYKLAKYFYSKTKFTFMDDLIFKVGSTCRIIMITSVGLNLFFYSMHCLVHMSMQLPLPGFISKLCRLQSMLILVIIPVDFILLVQDN